MICYVVHCRRHGFLGGHANLAPGRLWPITLIERMIFSPKVLILKSVHVDHIFTRSERGPNTYLLDMILSITLSQRALMAKFTNISHFDQFRHFVIPFAFLDWIHLKG